METWKTCRDIKKGCKQRGHGCVGCKVAEAIRNEDEETIQKLYSYYHRKDYKK
jgi:hypothetical protein